MLRAYLKSIKMEWNDRAKIDQTVETIIIMPLVPSKECISYIPVIVGLCPNSIQKKGFIVLRVVILW